MDLIQRQWIKSMLLKVVPSDNPLILHVPNSESIKPLVTEGFKYSTTINGYVLAWSINDHIA